MVKWSDLLLGVGAIARVAGSIPGPSCENSSDQELDLGMTYLSTYVNFQKILVSSIRISTPVQ